jgi:hypothetical protein
MQLCNIVHDNEGSSVSLLPALTPKLLPVIRPRTLHNHLIEERTVHAGPLCGTELSSEANGARSMCGLLHVGREVVCMYMVLGHLVRVLGSHSPTFAT